MVPGQTKRPLRIVVIGLTITSSWGNGHATTYRSLLRGLHARGHSALFLEHDKPWYRAHRDLTGAPYAEICLYGDVDELARRFRAAIRDADLVMLGSYVPCGIAVGQLVQECARGVTAFYDIDTPVTLTALEEGSCQYLSPGLIPGFDLYLSFTGGPVLRELEDRFSARIARPLYCSADSDLRSSPAPTPARWDLSYLGTYSPDRQPPLEMLLCNPARAWPTGRFVVAGPQYPADIDWPDNCERIEHLPPEHHHEFYSGSRFTLNVTRAAMVRLGYSPSVRLFEAACCGTPIISDWWPGLDTLFQPGEEILIARSAHDVSRYLREIPDKQRTSIAARARARVLASHTGDHRAAELESYVRDAMGARAQLPVTTS